MSTEERRYAQELKLLALAVLHGRRDAAEMDRLVRKSKIAFDALYRRFYQPEHVPRHIGRGCMD